MIKPRHDMYDEVPFFLLFRTCFADVEDYVMDYLSFFPDASREHPRFMAFAEAVLQQAVDLISLIASLQSGFSFAAAEGKQMDDLAAAVGLARESGMTDESFRQYLLAKLALWTWDGMNEDVKRVLDAALPGSTQTDNQDGTVTAAPVQMLPADAGELFPVPAGIRLVEEEGI